MADHPKQRLCDDVLVEIFLRIPVKAVFKFKCVSKKWNHVFSCELFRVDYESRKKSHHRRPNHTDGDDELLPSISGFFRCFVNPPRPCETSNEPGIPTIPGNIERMPTGVGKLLLYCHDEPRITFIPARLESMPIRSRKFLDKLGYCFAESNGVILCGFQRDTYFVCNPIKDKWFRLPESKKRNLDHAADLVVVGLLYEEECTVDDQDDGPGQLFRRHYTYTVMRVDCTRGYRHMRRYMEIETYSSDSGVWEESELWGATPFCVPIGYRSCGRCKVVGSTFFWKGKTTNNQSLLVAYDYKFTAQRQDDGDGGGRQRWVWLIQDALSHDWGDLILAESNYGHLLRARDFGSSFRIFRLKNRLQSYSYDSVVPGHEWTEIVQLQNEIPRDTWTQNPRIIEFHPQNSGLVLMRCGSTIFWYDLESGESRSIWHLGVPLLPAMFESLRPVYHSDWPPML